MPILLILMMLVTPIASAFNHCSGMDLMGHISESQSLTITVSVKDADGLNHKGMLNVENTNQVELDCQTGNSCTFHSCGIISSVSTVDTVIPLYYSYFEYLSPYNTDQSPDLKPPIMIL